MIYDAFGREIPDDPRRPVEGQFVRWEPTDRYQPQPSVGMSPESLTALLNKANQGEPKEQALLSREILEKDWDTLSAIGTRCASVLADEWCCEPPEGLEDDPTAMKIADAANVMLQSCVGEGELLGTEGLLSHMLGALLPGYAVAEIIWQPGGKGIAGFNPVLSEAITFRNSLPPLLATNNHPEGIPLLARKFVVHRHRALSGDATRGGLIRPLGWMFCFSQFNIKNQLRFVEKFGMPFVAARVEDGEWDKSRSVLASIIRNFGTDGGGVFTKAVELELLQAAQGDGEVFFRSAQYWREAKTLVIQGQLATSSQGGGLSSNNAQENVRNDLTLGDQAQVARSMRASVLQPWTIFNFGEGAPVPCFKFEREEERDDELRSKVFVNLKNAGWRATQKAVQDEFGIEVEPVESAPALAMTETSLPARQMALSKANDAIVGAALKRLAAEPAIAGEWLRPLADVMDEAFAGLSLTDPADAKTGLKRLRARLNDLPAIAAAMKSGKLEGLLSEAMFAADANGRAATVDGLKRG